MERPPIKDKAVSEYVDHLEKELLVYQRSPYVDSYLACLMTIARWNEQLKGNEINLLDPEDKDKFSMAHKFITESKAHLEQLEYIRKIMNPEETKKVEEEIRSGNIPIAERMALEAKNKANENTSL